MRINKENMKSRNRNQVIFRIENDNAKYFSGTHLGSNVISKNFIVNNL
jgi:hypothetical protein